jgi:hypothetical protein
MRISTVQEQVVHELILLLHGNSGTLRPADKRKFTLGLGGNQMLAYARKLAYVLRTK